MKKSWLLPGAIDVDYTLTRVTLMPYTSEQADLLQAAVLRVCPLARFSAQAWPPYEYQEVLNFDLQSTTPKTRSETGVTRIDVEFDCLEALNLTFDELHLLKLQRRRWVSREGIVSSRRELYTGETPKFIPGERGNVEKPASYLPDYLVKIEEDRHQGPKCPICDAIDSTLNPTSPPILNETLPGPPFLLHDISGTFASLTECESRPSGSFIRRILTLHPETSEWQGEYQHYTEPDCQQRSFTILGNGTYTLDDTYTLLPTAQKIDFLVMKATVTPHLDFVLQQLSVSNESDCGVGPWAINRPKDITSTNGCRLLGLTIPNADFNIIRLEHDRHGHKVIYLGQDHQDNNQLEPIELPTARPTSFQPGLIQCRNTTETPITTATRMMTVNHRLVTANRTTTRVTLPTTTVTTVTLRPSFSSYPASRKQNGSELPRNSLVTIYIAVTFMICAIFPLTEF